MPDIEQLGVDEWPTLREIRLTALQESPDAFLASYDIEREFDEAKWRAEFGRGEWLVARDNRLPVSVLGCTREEDTPPWMCYLEHLWVAPQCRRKGLAFTMITHAIARLRGMDMRLARLWVLAGNDAAVRLYKRAGFISANYSQALPGRPGVIEELMELELG